MCTQNETIMKSVSEPLPSFLNSFNDIQNLKLIETSINENLEANTSSKTNHESQGKSYFEFYFKNIYFIN